jgi:CTP-dependent riboflavin kinase
MKKLLLILLCVPLIGFGQTWKYRSGENDFDGKYRTAYVIGTGNDWPYDSPQLVVNYWEDNKNLNLYISKAGYFNSGSGTTVYFSFSNENEMVYVCDDLSYSTDNEEVFMDNFYLRDNYNEEFDKIEIIEKLMNASYVNIRISNDYGQNTMKFSLRGSTKAIKFVIPDIESILKEFEITKIEEEEAIQIKEEAIKIKEKEIEVAKKKLEEENKMGCLSGDCEDGLGTYKYATGDIYVGEWSNGYRHGKGTLNVYTIKESSFGIEIRVISEIQEGQWQNDKFLGN